MIRAVPAVAVTCDHTDDRGTPCPAQLMLRATDTGDIPVAEVRVAALLRGWATDGGAERCPTHRTEHHQQAAPAAPTGGDA